VDLSPDLTWHDLHHAELGVTDLYAVLALRNRVFVVEQACCYQDVDGLDLVDGTRHLLVKGDGGRLVAYARLLAPAGDGPARIGRVIVSDEARGRALGRRLMEAALGSCEEHWPGAGVQVSAQAHLHAFYASLGFAAVGDVYDDDGIPHLDMRLP
jgi:ElaA protein